MQPHIVLSQSHDGYLRVDTWRGDRATLDAAASAVNQEHTRNSETETMIRSAIPLFCCTFFALASPGIAAEWHVAAGGAGNGTATAPFGRIQSAIDAAQPGDTVIVGPGTFAESLVSVRSGTLTSRITLRSADGRGTTIVTNLGRVLTVNHAYFTVEGLVLDGEYGANDLVRVGSIGHGFTLRNTEVRRAGNDAVDMGAISDALIENSLIHHALNPTNGRTDAHGVVGGAVQRLTIRNTEIHTFSGDGVQIDPGRAAPGWNDVLIEGCRIWLAPLPAAENGFPAGAVTGENAVDTKASFSLPRARITIRDTEASGFRWPTTGSNIAAFNLKENIDATVDGVTVRDSEIGFRLRGGSGITEGAFVRVQNAVVHSVDVGVRYEDNIQNLRIWNTTFGSGVKQTFYSASSSGSVLDVRNVLVLGSLLLPQAPSGASNLAVGASAFVNAAAHNYQLATPSPAFDAGMAIADVTVDRQGTRRPQGTAYDIGAYERVVLSEPPPPPPGDPTPPPPAPPPPPDEAPDVVMHAYTAANVVGNWLPVPDATAAGGLRVESLDQGARRLNKPAARPADYFELTFYAAAGIPYRLWLRGKAAGSSQENDSVYVQFSDSVDATGLATFRIGTASATIVNLQDCSKCALSGWGWQDNGGNGALGQVIYFAQTWTHTIRIQTREDGLSIDQIVLSPSAYLTNSPGRLVNDATILAESNR